MYRTLFDPFVIGRKPNLHDGVGDVSSWRDGNRMTAELKNHFITRVQVDTINVR